MIDSYASSLLSDRYGLASKLIKPATVGLGESTFIVISESDTSSVLKYYNIYTRAESIAKLHNYLAEQGAPVPHVILNREGDLVCKQGKKYAVLYTFCKGVAIGWTEISSKLSPELSRDLARITSNLHAVLLKDSESVNPHINILEYKSSDLAISSTLNKTKLRRSIIHGDITRENVLLTTDRNAVNAIIDFDDAKYGYLAYDIAVLLTQIYVTKTWGIDMHGIADFMSAYSSELPLNKEELESIYTFMVQKNNELITECNQKLAEHIENQETLLSIHDSASQKLKLLELHQSELQTILNGHE